MFINAMNKLEKKRQRIEQLQKAIGTIIILVN